MAKALVICETRSRAEALSRALGGRFAGEEALLEGVRFVLTWTAGAPAELAAPELYDASHATWELDALPIVPAPFVLTPRADDDAAAQLRAIRAAVRRRDIDRVVNACEPGAEGELIFAYVRELAEVNELPVERVLLESLQRPAIRRARPRLVERRTGGFVRAGDQPDCAVCHGSAWHQGDFGGSSGTGLAGPAERADVPDEWERHPFRPREWI